MNSNLKNNSQINESLNKYYKFHKTGKKTI